MKLYMRVTDDIYELPMFVSERVKYLSEDSGVPESSIHSMLSKQRNNIKQTLRWREVEYEFDREKLAKLISCIKPQKKFFVDLGIQRDTVNNWLSGKTEPNFNTMDDLCLYFGVDEDYFIKECD